MAQVLEINPEIPSRASVIWLHGLGASGHDLIPIAEQLNLPKELGIRHVFPHAPVRQVQCSGNAKMRAWFDIITIGSKKEDEDGIKKSEKIIGELISQELARGIPNEKIVIAGFSQGGAMALQCGLRYEKKLAGILVLSSWLPLPHTVSAEKHILNQKTPILMLHGTVDPVVQINWAEESYNYLKKLGYPITMSSYQMQHTICQEEIVAIGLWMRKILS